MWNQIVPYSLFKAFFLILLSFSFENFLLKWQIFALLIFIFSQSSIISLKLVKTVLISTHQNEININVFKISNNSNRFFHLVKHLIFSLKTQNIFTILN